VASLVPFDALDTALVTLPGLLGQFWGVDGPKVNFIAAGSGQLAFVLPSDVHDLACLLELEDCLLLDRVGVPDENTGVVSA